MVGDHRTSERVYDRLKADLLSRGLGRDGINIAILADRYDASVTPVREALMRLVGEDLVHMPASGGFTIPQIDFAMAQDCYQMSQALSLLVARFRPNMPIACGSARPRSPLEFPIDAVLEALACTTGNQVFVSAIASLNDRMHPLRLMEEARLRGLAAEFNQLLETVKSDDKSAIARTLNKYHRRRQRAVSRILGVHS